MKGMKDDLGRDWAGNFERQRFIESRIRRNARLSDEHPIDVAGAVGTIVANVICDIADNEEQALEGLRVHFADMEKVVRARFAKKTVN